MPMLFRKTSRVVLAMLMFLGMATAQKSPNADAKKPSPVAGDWQGTLEAGGQKLHLALHIKQAADGTFSGTLDSLDQGANGIVIEKIVFQNGKLSFTSNAVQGSYEGKLTSDSTIEGTWSQGQPLPLNFKRATKASAIDGYWLGTLDAGLAKLRVLFTITNTPEGLQATLNSLDQGGGAIPVTSVQRDGQNITMELKDIGSSFTGTLDEKLAKIDGTWSQGGKTRPLTIAKVDSEQVRAASNKPRPQDPKKPYPYRAEDVKYENKSAGITLGGTITLPQGKGPFPAVLLITGSGQQDRDEALLGHRPFLVLADYLTRKGIAVLRVDDRGMGESTGKFNLATTADFATDVEAGVAYLKTRPEVDIHKIGLIGHSEGGVIAPMVAARNHDVAFIVMMAGTGVPGDQVIAEQTRLILEADGMSHEAAAKRGASELETLALVKQEKDPEVLAQKLRERLAGKLPEAQIGAAILQVNSPWMRYFINYDPAIALSKVTCPVLVLNGAKDLQVSPEQNLPPIRRALEAAGNKHFEIAELPGLNHLFQTAKTGSPSEYAQIDETIAPVALETIAGWIIQQ